MKYAVLLLSLLSQPVLAKKSFLFSEKAIKEIQSLGIAELAKHEAPYPQEAFENMFAKMHHEFRIKYPQKINSHPRWIFNTAGGALGQLAVLHCSLKEYLIFFCAPMPTEAYTGDYRMDIRDFYLSGVIEHFAPGQFTTTKFYPGEMSLLKKGEGFNYRALGGNCMIEYGRGNVTSGFKFGITGPAKNITNDKRSSRAQISDCMKNTFGKTEFKKTKEVFPNSIPFKRYK